VTKALVEIAKTVIQLEADSILKLKDRIDQSFVEAYCKIVKEKWF
jgi:hypothetical protein